MSDAPVIPGLPARTHGRLLFAIVALGVLLRLALAMLHPFLFDDSKDYIDLAHRLLLGHPYGVDTRDGFMTASRMPGYPLFLAAIFAFGESIRAVAVVQAFLSGGILLLVFAISRRAGEKFGLLATTLAALDPLSIGFSAAILSETPFTLFFLLGLWAALRHMEVEFNNPSNSGPLWQLLLGTAWGIAIYLRASLLWCIVPVSLLLVVRARWRFWALGCLILPFGAMTIVLAPWVMRIGQPFLSMTSLEGISLYEAVYPGADGGPKQDVIPLPQEIAAMDEWQRDAAWKHRAFADIRADPFRILRLAGVKFARTWSPWLNGSDLRSVLVQSALILWQVPLFILTLIGIFFSKMPRGLKPLLLVPILYFSALHSLFLGSVRYRVPLMPLVCIFAAAGAVTCYNRFMAKRTAAKGV